MGDYASLPTTNADLETSYTAQNVTDVATDDTVRVSQTGKGQFMIHQFKDFIGGSSYCQLNWDGQSTLAPSASTVYLQIYNFSLNQWDTVDSDNATAANTDFALTYEVADTTNYKDNGVVSCRVYQEAI